MSSRPSVPSLRARSGRAPSSVVLVAPLAVAVALAAVPACGRGHEPGAGPRASSRPIYNGSPDDAPAHAAVVALLSPAYDGFFCTGTLITPDVVLTAAHCLEGLGAGEISVFFGDDVDGVGSTIEALEILAHPDYSSSQMHSDIGLIRLAAPSSVTPIPALPEVLALTAADASAGIPLDFSGFGDTETGSYGVKLHWIGPLGHVCAGPSSCTYLANDIVPYGIAYAQSEGGPCSGDSGGPAFVGRDGTEYVAGVTSYGDWDCAVYGVSTHVAPFDGWIGDFTGAAPREACERAGDEDGDGAADCADSDCAGRTICACASAPVLDCGAEVSGETGGGTTGFGTYGSCTDEAEAGPERAYRLAAPAGAEVTIALTVGGPGDLDLFLLAGGGGTCLPSGCLDASLNGQTDPEELRLTMPAGGAFVVVDTYDAPGSYTLRVSCAGLVEDCDNDADDDADGAADCDDPDCAALPSCAAPPAELCGNETDDDADGAVDCADPDCVAEPACAGGGGDDDGGGCGCRAGGPGRPAAPRGLAGLALGVAVLGRRGPRRRQGLARR